MIVSNPARFKSVEFDGYKSRVNEQYTVMARNRIKWHSVDDLFAENVTLDIIRLGDARYRMRMNGEQTHCEILVWTTRKARIRVHVLGSAAPAAITLSTDSEGVLEHCLAENVAVHCEQMDRNLYYLGIFSKDGDFVLLLHADGYIKTHLLMRNRLCGGTLRVRLLTSDNMMWRP